MKIAILGYNTCCLNHTGGVQVRVKQIFNLLSQRDNIEVEFFRPMETDLDSVDVIHLFKLEPEYYNLVMKAKTKGKKIVLSSIVPITGGLKLLFYRLLNILPILTIYKMQQEILRTVDKIITETYQEAVFIKKYYGIKMEKIVVIPNGVALETYEGDEIFKYLGGKKEYILQVGLIHENKNQYNTIKALKDTGLSLVIIGGCNNGDMRYVDKCKQLAANDNHIHFIGWVDSNSNLLKSAYSNAKVMVFPSFNETFGIVALEGAIAGCNMAMTKTLPIHDFHAFDDCWLFDPYNVDDMREKILSAFYSEKNPVTRNKVMSIFSWPKIIDDHINLYNSI